MGNAPGAEDAPPNFLISHGYLSLCSGFIKGQIYLPLLYRSVFLLTPYDVAQMEPICLLGTLYVQ